MLTAQNVRDRLINKHLLPIKIAEIDACLAQEFESFTPPRLSELKKGKTISIDVIIDIDGFMEAFIPEIVQSYIDRGFKAEYVNRYFGLKHNLKISLTLW